jgi:hypothetical protein
MHQMIVGTKAGQLVDHMDKDGLNNQAGNLRGCDRSQNVMYSSRYRPGRSRYKGVDIHGGKWRARIAAYGKRIHLGCYETEEEAARSYDLAAVRHHGEFAVLNLWRGASQENHKRGSALKEERWPDKGDVAGGGGKGETQGECICERSAAPRQACYPSAAPRGV